MSAGIEGGDSCFQATDVELRVPCFCCMIPHSCCECDARITAGGRPHFLFFPNMNRQKHLCGQLMPIWSSDLGIIEKRKTNWCVSLFSHKDMTKKGDTLSIGFKQENKLQYSKMSTQNKTDENQNTNPLFPNPGPKGILPCMS